MPSSNEDTTIEPVPQHPQIILALSLMSTDPPRFHWFIFVPSSQSSELNIQAGLKIHAIDENLGKSPVRKHWAFEAVEFTLATYPGVAAAAVVGYLYNDRTLEQLRSLLEQIPLTVPPIDHEREPTFTCRVWIREALRRMHMNGFILCPDVDAMEAQMWRYGRLAAEAIEKDTFSVATLVTAENSCALVV